MKQSLCWAHPYLLCFLGLWSFRSHVHTQPTQSKSPNLQPLSFRSAPILRAVRPKDAEIQHIKSLALPRFVQSTVGMTYAARRSGMTYGRQFSGAARVRNHI